MDREADLLVRGLDSGDSLKGDLLLHNILLIGFKGRLAWEQGGAASP